MAATYPCISRNATPMVAKRVGSALLLSAAATALLAAAPGLKTPAAAADTLWTGTAGSDWNNPANWSNGLPADNNGSASVIEGATPAVVNGIAVVGSGRTWVGRPTGDGTLVVQGGGTLNAGVLELFGTNGFAGYGVVNGAGSVLSASSAFIGAYSGVGHISVENGGVLSTAGTGYVGQYNGSLGTVAVTGAGSVWNNGSRIYVGGISGNYSATGIVTIAEGGVVKADNGAREVYVGNGLGATGIVNIGAAEGDVATAAGTLQAKSLIFGTGNSFLVFNHTDTGYNFSVPISGTGEVRQISGTTILSGANSWLGSAVIEGGELKAGSAGAFSSNSAFAVNGGILNFNDLDHSIAALSGAGGAVSLGTAALTVNQAGDTSYAGVISGTGGLTKSGTGALELTGQNTYSGGTILEGGTLVQGAAGAFNANTAYTINDGILDLNNFNLTAASLSGNGGALSLGTGTLTIDQNSDTAFAGNFSSEGGTWMNSLVKTGSGKLSLTGTGGLAGNILIDGGTLEVNGAMAFSGFRHVGQNNEGTLLVSGAGAQLSAQSNDYIGSRGTGRVTVSDGGLVNAWNTTLGEFASGNGTLTVDGTGSVYRSYGSINVGYHGRGQLTVSGGATVQGLNHNWTKIGYDQGASGQVLITGTDSKWIGSNRFYLGEYGEGTLTVADGGLLQTNQLLIAQESWNSIDSIGVLNIGAAGGGPAAPGSVQASSIRFGDGDGTINFNHTGTGYVFSAPISGDGAINHLAGETTLTGDSVDFMGTTTVSGGVLSINGALGGTVNVAAAGTLGGSGHIGGNVGIDGTLAAGNSPGTLTIDGNLTLGVASNSIFELGAPGIVGGVQNDLIEVGGDLVLGGTLNATVAAAGYYRLFEYDGSLSGTFATENVVSNGGGFVVNQHRLITDVTGEVNLLALGNGQHMQFWDGGDAAGNDQIDGGAGIWNAADTNWTGAPGAAGINDRWRGSVAVFGGTAGGIVTVDGAADFDTLQFSTDEYRIEGDDLEIQPASGSNGTVQVDGGVTVTITSTISDDGNDHSLTKTGAGTLILEGANRHGGGTIITGGTLQGNTGSLQGDFVNNSTLVFEQDFSGEFSGILTGNGTFNKNGQGTLILSGDSSAFAGATYVQGGTLQIDGKLGGLLTVDDGMLIGSGTLNQLVVADGGILAPGNSIGTTNAGDVSFAAGSTYEVEVNDGGNTAGTNNDITLATGTATIDSGASVYVKPVNGIDDGSTYVPGTVYTILTASGGVTGEFNPTVIDDFALLDGALSYDANNVYLELNKTIQLNDVGRTANQKTVGARLEDIGTGNEIYDAMILMREEGNIRSSLDQLSGEIHASARTALLDDSRFWREGAQDRLHAAFGDAGQVGSAPDDNGAFGMQGYGANGYGASGFWARGFGSWSKWDGDSNAAGFNRSTGGFLLGGDGEVMNGLRFGLLGGYSRSSFDVDGLSSSGTADSWTVGAYGGGSWDALTLTGGLAHSWHSLDTSRRVAFTGFSDRLKASYDARTLQVWGEAAYNVDAGSARFQPFANIAHVNLSTDGFTEKGGAAALKSGSDTTAATYTTLGVRAESDLQLDGVNARLRGMAGWRHVFADTPDSRMRFASGGNAFTISGVPHSRDALVVDAGIDVNLTANATLGLAYGGQFGSGLQDHSANVSLNVKF